MLNKGKNNLIKIPKKKLGNSFSEEIEYTQISVF